MKYLACVDPNQAHYLGGRLSRVCNGFYARFTGGRKLSPVLDPWDNKKIAMMLKIIYQTN